MILPLTGTGITSVVIFSTWHFASFIVKFKQGVLSLTSGSIDIVYTLLMSYFLVTLSSTFLIILLLLTAMKTIIGGLAILTPAPDDYISRKNEIVENFWLKTAIDAIIGLVCYCIMLWGGIAYE